MTRRPGMRVLAVHLLALAAVAVGPPSLVGAQQRPDFSGEWTMAAESAPEAAAPGQRGGRGQRTGDMGSGWGSPMTITQDANRLVLQYAFFTRGDLQPPLRFIYALDGTESRNTVMMGRGIQAQFSRATWQGSTLVITTRHRYANPVTGDSATAEMRQALTLESPTSLVVEATRVGVLGGPANTVRTTYTKR